MRSSRTNTSALPVKRNAVRDEERERDTKRPEGAVSEHRTRARKNAASGSAQDVSEKKANTKD